jgi:hypothetical protein
MTSAFKVALAHQHARAPTMAVPGERAMIQTGIVIQIPDDCYRVGPPATNAARKKHKCKLNKTANQNGKRSL